jgi:Response regulator containing CheY-like receiver, AAA-type ATPase, and DNA-binding domains
MSKQRVVLIVEDDFGLRRMWRLALSFAGFEILEAGDGIEALYLVEQNRPDIVVLDLGLPKLDGISVVQEIAAHAYSRHIPIVVVTSSTQDLTHIDVSCILRKPVTPETVEAAIRKCLQSGAPGAAI